MRIRRRRGQSQPVVLPSLDRLSGLIERVVELVDAVGEAKPAPPPAPAPEPPQPEPMRDEAPQPEPVAAAGWVAFAHTANGYRLVERDGAVPAPGDAVELAEGAFRVLRIGPSPLPGDARRCAYLAGEELRQEDRTSDG